MTQGVDPELDFSNINSVRRDVEFCNRMPVGERHPYVGDLVYTAFSGSHQDAIKKGMEAMQELPDPETAVWDVPYLPFDPKDIGRNYDEAVRVNSQSGKGGVAYIMRAEHDLELPRLLQIEFTRTVQREVDASNAEMSASEMIKLFRREYMEHGDATLISHSVTSDDQSHLSSLKATLECRGDLVSVEGVGSGTISAFVAAIENLLDVKVKVRDYAQQTLSDGTNAKAISYLKLSIGDDTTWGVGEDTDTAKANFDAILSAVARVPGAWDRLGDRDSAGAEHQVSSPLKVEFRRLVQPLRDQHEEPSPVALVDYAVSQDKESETWRVEATVTVGGGPEERIEGKGNGAISAFVAALEARLETSIDIHEYAQQTLSDGTDAFAVSYVWIEADGATAWGIAEHTDTVSANLKAILSALGRVPQISERGQRV